MEAKWAAEGKILGQLIDQKFDGYSEFASLLGVSEDVVTNLVTGRTQLKGERRKKVARILNVSEDFFVARASVPMVAKEERKAYASNLGRTIPVARTGYRIIPIFGSVPAGNPATNFSDAIDYIEAPEWGSEFERWGRTVTGDSMSDPNEPGEAFEPGDIAIFENRRASENQGVHATRDGEDAFKILRRIKGRLEFWPINPAYPTFSAEDWNIMGVCVQRVRYGKGGIEDVRYYRHGLVWRF